MTLYLCVCVSHYVQQGTPVWWQQEMMQCVFECGSVNLQADQSVECVCVCVCVCVCERCLKL